MMHPYGYTALIIGDLAAQLDLELRGVAIDVVLGVRLDWPTLWVSDPDLIVLADFHGRVPEDIADAYRIARGRTLPVLVAAVRAAVTGQESPSAEEARDPVARTAP